MNHSTLSSDQTRQSGFSRRGFLKSVSAGSLVLMANLARGQVADAAKQDVESFDPDLFVSIAPYGTVTIIASRSEMGTGIRTALPRVVADELEADWNRVEIEQAPGDKRLGDQNTDGSRSVRLFFDRMRLAGATARTMLEKAAAKRWNVDPQECAGENHRVKHHQSGRSLGYEELVADAAALDVPEPDSLKFKPRSQWKYIGHPAPIADLDEIVTGKAIYGIDARLDNQLFAVIARPPVVGGKVKSFDASAAKKVKGVEDVVEIPGFEGAPVFQPLGGVAVCANSTWAAWQGRDALEIEWDDGPNASYNSQEFLQSLKESVRKPGKVARESGDANGKLDNAKNALKADYSVPHLAHASMEPPAAVADVKTDASGKVTSCYVLSATQNPQAVQQAVGKAMRIPPEEVRAEVTLLGSAFGRKSKPDYCVEAAMLSRQLGRPVHVTWTREDDVRHDYFHTIAAMHFEGSLDENGKPEAWLQRVAYPSIGSTFNPQAKEPAPFELEMGFKDIPYAIANLRVETQPAEAHVRIGWLRSVCHIPQNFGVCSFAGEMAHHAGRDPYEFLLELLGEDRRLDLDAAGLSNSGASPEDYPYDVGRLKHVTRRAAEAADWKRHSDLPKGRGLGIASCRSFLSYTAHVVEVEVSQQGIVSIPNVWICVDPGTIVSPDRVRAQLEGAAIMATSQVRYGEITFTNGRADQSNYDGFRMATMGDAPRNIEVEIVDSTAAPAGVGEVGIPSFAPALCNAIFAATGKRVRDLPLAKHDLSWS